MQKLKEVNLRKRTLSGIAGSDKNKLVMSYKLGVIFAVIAVLAVGFVGMPQDAFAQYDLNFNADVKGASMELTWNDIRNSGAVITTYHLTTYHGSLQFGADRGGTSYDAKLGSHPFLTSPNDTYEPGDTITYTLNAYDYDRRGIYGGGLLVATDTVIVTLPTNSAPVANAGQSQTVISDAENIILDGSRSYDSDRDELQYRWKSLNNTSISNTRAQTSSVDVPTVREGSATYAYELRVSDGLLSSTDIAYITVENTRPVANAGNDVASTINTLVNLNARASYDHDGSNLTYLWEQTSGTPVSFVNDTQRLVFTAPSSIGSLLFKLTVDDGELSASDNVRVRIVTTSPPVANTDNTRGYASHGQVVTLDGSGSSDPDDDTLRYKWEQLKGTTVVLDNNRAQIATFTAAHVSENLFFKLTVSDAVFSDSDNVHISIGSNRAPVIDIRGQVTEPTTYITYPTTNVNADYVLPSGGVTFTLDGSNSHDSDGDALSYRWEQIDGQTVHISGSRSDTASFRTHSITDASLLTFKLTVTDIVGNASFDEVTIYVDGIARPIANAGTDFEAVAGDKITLDGSGSFSPLDTALTYSWTQTSGTTIAPANANRVTTTVQIPSTFSGSETLTYKLTVHDIDRRSDSDLVNIEVTEKVRPIADAGLNQNVDSGDMVTLNGSGSMIQISGDLTYLWTQTGGNIVTLSNNTIASPTFTAPSSTFVVLTFMLTLTDSDDYSDSDSVVITVGSNSPPVADAGSDIPVMSNTFTTLRGSATDVDNDSLTYSWTQLSGTDVTIRNENTMAPSFMSPDVTSTETLVFQMTVVDSFGNMDTDIVSIVVSPTVVPTSVGADAGNNQRVNVGDNVSLDGSRSTGDSLTYSWTQTSGNSITFSNNSIASPTFTAPSSAGIIVLTLTVTSGIDTDSDDVNIEVISTNSPPVADAGSNQEVRTGGNVVLAGSGTDPDSDALTYSWTQISGTTIVISNNDKASASFTAPSNTGALVFKLTISDAFGHTASDNVRINVVSTSPIADAGINIETQPNSLVRLDGSGSYDPDGDSLTYSWTQIEGTDVVLSGSTGTSPTFTSPIIADDTLTFSLTVDDNNGNRDTDNVNVYVYSSATIANAGNDRPVTIGDWINLDGSDSSVGFGSAEYSWEQLSGTPVVLDGYNYATPSFAAPDSPTTIVFKLTVTNGLSSDTDTIQIIVDASGIPIVDLGPDITVDSGETVKLSVNEVDSDGVTYGWNVLSWHYVILDGENTPSVSFTAPVIDGGTEEMVISVYVYDGAYYVEDEITITVVGNAKPIINIVEQYTIPENQRATMDASGTHDPDGDRLTYLWEQISGTTVNIIDADKAVAYFDAPDAPTRVTNTNSLVFELTVSDGVNIVKSTVVLGVNEIAG